MHAELQVLPASDMFTQNRLHAMISDIQAAPAHGGASAWSACAPVSSTATRVKEHDARSHCCRRSHTVGSCKNDIMFWSWCGFQVCCRRRWRVFRAARGSGLSSTRSGTRPLQAARCGCGAQAPLTHCSSRPRDPGRDCKCLSQRQGPVVPVLIAYEGCVHVRAV